jgi:hypothetical protein
MMVFRSKAVFAAVVLVLVSLAEVDRASRTRLRNTIQHAALQLSIWAQEYGQNFAVDSGITRRCSRAGSILAVLRTASRLNDQDLQSH